MACVKWINAEQRRSFQTVVFVYLKCAVDGEGRFKYQDISVCLVPFDSLPHTQSFGLMARGRFYDGKDILQIAAASRNKFTQDPATEDAVLCGCLL